MFLEYQASFVEGCISDLAFDTWHAGDLDKATDRALSQHLTACAACARRDRNLREQARRYVLRADYAAQVERLSTALARPRPALVRVAAAFRRPWQASLALAAALCLLWLAPRSDLGLRRKGGDGVSFYVRRGETLFRGQSGQHVQPRDLLRFTWRSDRAAYLAILSLDAKRVVSTYYPAEGVQRRLVPSGAEIELPNAVELDETLGPEQVFVVSCTEPPDLTLLRRMLGESGQLRVSKGCKVTNLTLLKESPR